MTGATLKKIRNSKGLTQEQLAKKLGYASRYSILEMERGRRKVPFLVAQAVKLITHK